MKVKIVKCSSDRAWYKDRIGEVFEVIRLERGGWISVFAEESTWGLVLKADTIPVSEIRYDGACTTKCPNDEYCCMVGSFACERCDYNCSRDTEAQTVLCSWQKMKRRLDIKQYYNDNSIKIEQFENKTQHKISVKGVYYSEDLIIRIGSNHKTTLNQANAILKVMGLDYELYEVDWSKVEEGAEVNLIYDIVYDALVEIKIKANFHSYIPTLKKVVVIIDSEVKVVDEDKVELV